MRRKKEILRASVKYDGEQKVENMMNNISFHNNSASVSIFFLSDILRYYVVQRRNKLFMNKSCRNIGCKNDFTRIFFYVFAIP